MRYAMRALLPAILCAAAAGCITKRGGVPAVTLGRLTTGDLQSTDYETLVQTQGQSSGGSILFLLDYGDDPAEYVPTAEEGTESATPLVDGKTMTAVFRAIDGIPGANAVLNPMVTRSSSHFLFWSSWSVTVEGTAVKILKIAEDDLRPSIPGDP